MVAGRNPLVRVAILVLAVGVLGVTLFRSAQPDQPHPEPAPPPPSTQIADGGSMLASARPPEPPATEAPTELGAATESVPTTAPKPKSKKKRANRWLPEPDARVVEDLTIRGKGGESVTAQWKLNERKRCAAHLEPLTESHQEKVDDRGKWARNLVKKIQKGIVLCPNVYPPPSGPAAEPGSRRILIDLGAAEFGTSVASMLLWYNSMRYFEIHAFEADTKAAASYAAVNRPPQLAWTLNTSITFHNVVLGAREGFVSYISDNPKHRENFLKDRQLTSTSGSMVYHATRAETPTNAYLTVEAWNICDYLVNRLKVTPRDYVILKVDIEGGEWDVLDALENQPVCKSEVLGQGLIDELFFECHYAEMGMNFRGKSFQDCKSVYDRYRAKYHIFAHEWV